MNPLYSKEQQDFLEEFYQGITDPELKFQLLLQNNGEPGNSNYHATKIDKQGNATHKQDSEFPFANKIATEEYYLLVKNGLITPQYY